MWRRTPGGSPRPLARVGATLEIMRLAVKARRAGIRCAYIGLRAYWFLTRPHVIGVKCVVTHGDDVLLVRHTYGHRAWDLPGGTVKRREVPLAAAQREMHEELGRRRGLPHRFFGREVRLVFALLVLGTLGHCSISIGCGFWAACGCSGPA